jgi:hypothetical protein
MLMKCLFFSILSIGNLFSNHYQESLNEEESFIVFFKAANAIDKYSAGKLYINESRIFLKENSIGIELDDGNFFISKCLSSDEEGFFLSCCKLLELNKLFKLICQNCGHEWAGGVFTYCCEKCGSHDFSVVPNW